MTDNECIFQSPRSYDFSHLGHCHENTTLLRYQRQIAKKMEKSRWGIVTANELAVITPCHALCFSVT
eukprot:COSAG02_NODE_2506_length_8652_cov_226.221677_2_plen_67_part_00